MKRLMCIRPADWSSLGGLVLKMGEIYNAVGEITCSGCKRQFYILMEDQEQIEIGKCACGEIDNNKFKAYDKTYFIEIDELAEVAEQYSTHTLTVPMIYK